MWVLLKYFFMTQIIKRALTHWKEQLYRASINILNFSLGIWAWTSQFFPHPSCSVHCVLAPMYLLSLVYIWLISIEWFQNRGQCWPHFIGCLALLTGDDFIKQPSRRILEMKIYYFNCNTDMIIFIYELKEKQK